ncbi:MAG: hypothetical protein KKG84_01010 [Candidatus Omnitrophica bacterium]|nr:hypothetical protein [Candidatus Omnitrophota bacterium]
MEKIGRILDSKMPVKLGINKRNEIVRLIYEISLREGLSPIKILEQEEIRNIIEKGKAGSFAGIKKALIRQRYPSSSGNENIRIMPVKIKETDRESPVWKGELRPRSIFVERSVRQDKWTLDFLSNFPQADVTVIDKVSAGLGGMSPKKNVERYALRRDNVFIIKGKTAFIKACPCTKGAVSCGYQVLNIGFGCPIDCSYCYLQTYSNASGLILPANIEDYFEQISEFDGKLSVKTRIGTGEFTDSLALDKYTRYSSKLIPFFRGTKNLVLELKTKVSDIHGVLSQEPHDNIVISWSLNAEKISDSYEKGAPSTGERIRAASEAASKGYKLGFHFDPIVYCDRWEEKYGGIIEELFSYEAIRKKVSWISLGSLRYTPGLKQIAERRFDDNLLFYRGELFEDAGGKFRYKDDVRIGMYRAMLKEIRKFNSTCWVYLCMETENIWKRSGVANFLELS